MDPKLQIKHASDTSGDHASWVDVRCDGWSRRSSDSWSRSLVHSSVMGVEGCVTFCNTPKLILTNLKLPTMLWDPVRLTPNPDKHRTHVGDASSTLKSPCLSSDSRTTWQTPTEHQSPSRLVAVKTLGTNYPHLAPGHPSHIRIWDQKPDLGSHCNPELSSPYSNIFALLFPSWPWVSYSCMHPLFIRPCIPVAHDTLLWLQYIRTLHPTS